MNKYSFPFLNGTTFKEEVASLREGTDPDKTAIVWLKELEAKGFMMQEGILTSERYLIEFDDEIVKVGYPPFVMDPWSHPRVRDNRGKLQNSVLIANHKRTGFCYDWLCKQYIPWIRSGETQVRKPKLHEVRLYRITAAGQDALKRFVLEPCKVEFNAPTVEEVIRIYGLS